ncbi:MAG: hypothetical protein ACOX46_06355 [Limnochordia bacterium]
MTEETVSPEHQAYLRSLRHERRPWSAAPRWRTTGNRAFRSLGSRGLPRAGSTPSSSPSPPEIWAALVRLYREGGLWRHLGWTVWETVLGFSGGHRRQAWSSR